MLFISTLNFLSSQGLPYNWCHLPDFSEAQKNISSTCPGAMVFTIKVLETQLVRGRGVCTVGHGKVAE
jgi:hypothetical protein